MKKLTVVIIFLAVVGVTKSQNLVQNPSFETVNTGSLICSWYLSQAEFNSAIVNWTCPTDGTTDVFHSSLAVSCFSHPLSTNGSAVGQQSPRTGSSMSALCTYGNGGCSPWREYVQGSLSSALVPGQQYCVEFYVSLADYSTYASNNLGVYFTTSAWSTTNGGCPYFVTPQVNYTGPIITNKTAWTLVSFTFIPTQAFTHFTIGNFFNDVSTLSVNTGGTESVTRYFIDDVSVQLCSVNPTVTVNSPTICNGQTATLTAAGANTYAWSSGASGSTVSVSPAVTTSYTVTGTNTTGGTGTAIATVTVNAAPSVSTTASPTSVCPGVSSTLTASGAATYSWSTGGSGASISVSPAATTTYTVTGTSASGCTGTATLSVVVNTAPTVLVTSASICQGASATLTASGAAIYSWSTGASTASITASPVVTTTYTTTGTNALGCTSTASGTITVNPIPSVSASASPASVCPGNSSTLTAVGAATYSWSTGGSVNSISVSPTANTTYSVTGTTAVGCSGSAMVSVAVLPGPVVTTTGATICEGNPATISASGATNYSWSNGSAGSSIVVSPTSTATYTVSGTDGSGCTGIATASVVVNPLPVITVNSPSVCAGIAADLTASGADSYLWNTGSSANPLNVSPAVTTSYSVTGTNTNGCSNTAQATVTINAAPTLTLTTTADYCGSSNGTATVVAAGGATPYTYAWNSNPPQATDVATNLANGQYNVTVTDGNGCVSTGLATVFAEAAFSLSSSSTVEHCSQLDGSATVTAANALYPLTYSWSHNSLLNAANASNISAGTYTVSVSDGTCMLTTTIVVGFYSGPVAAYHPDKTVISLEDGPLYFSDMSSGAAVYYYDFGDGASSTQQNPSHQYTNSGTFLTMQVIVDEFGCVDTAYQEIVVNEGFAFFVPSAFSPNGDGRNDYFEVYGYGVDPNTFNMAIFDRWGEMVFYTTDLNKMWDGGRADAKKQEDISQSVYSYHITFKTLAGKDKEFFGRVVALP